MPNYELAISPNYVKDWGLQAAIREIIQNSLDQSHTNPDNEMLFRYDPSLQLLEIGNKTSSLDMSTLVLGNTSKDKSPELIGKFGEGYKLALIVLLRLGKAVTIYNNPSVWTPSIVQSDNFKTPVLNINVVKYRFKSLPEQDLIFKISGISLTEYEETVSATLPFQDVGPVIKHDYGQILLEERYKGNVYVKGLLVTHIDKLAYGYDLLPQHLTIGRDRDLVNQYDIYYKTSYMWASQGDYSQSIEKMIEDKAPDVTYIQCHIWKMPEDTVRVISDCWWQKNGTGALPCHSQKEADQARSLYGPSAKVIIVSEQMMSILSQSPQYKNYKANSISTIDPHKLVLKLMKHKHKLQSSVWHDVEALIEMSKHWKWKS